MVSESFKAYPSECLVGLSGHPLSGRYRTTHNMLSHAQAVTLGVSECVGDSTLTRDEDISLYTNGCKLYLIKNLITTIFIHLNNHYIN